MTDTKQNFINLIKNRSAENEKAVQLLFEQKLFGNCISILRQELDSFIRIMYLGRIPNIPERERLMALTLEGKKWNMLTENNKSKQITDKDMIEKANELKGYIHYVYKFGCAFIHLSDFQNYQTKNPFLKLEYNEEFDIKLYLYQYHGYPMDADLTVENISILIPDIFKKISENMACYFNDILNDDIIEM